jgi:ABC-type phosphate transport system substrate-binding protein
VPLTPENLKGYGVGQFPFVIGGAVAAVNIPGVVARQLKLTDEVLADIFLGLPGRTTFQTPGRGRFASVFERATGFSVGG